MNCVKFNFGKSYLPSDSHTNSVISEILFKLIVKVPVVGNTADTPNPSGLLPF